MNYIIAYLFAWWLELNKVGLPAKDNNLQGQIAFLEENIRNVEETPVREYWYRYPAVQLRVIGAKCLLKEFKKAL